MKDHEAITEIINEYGRQREKFGVSGTPHDRFYGMMDTMTDFREVLRDDHGPGDMAMKEKVVDLAAQALRFLADCIPD